MSKSTYNQELSQEKLQERTIIDAWIDDFPQIPPSPKSFSPVTAHPQRGRRQRSLQSRRMVEDNTEPLRRSKRNLPPPNRLEPPEPSTTKISRVPIKKARPAAKARGRGGGISKPRAQPLLSSFDPTLPTRFALLDPTSLQQGGWIAGSRLHCHPVLRAEPSLATASNIGRPNSGPGPLLRVQTPTGCSPLSPTYF
jgi:hypothetical protein